MGTRASCLLVLVELCDRVNGLAQPPMAATAVPFARRGKCVLSQEPVTYAFGTSVLAAVIAPTMDGFPPMSLWQLLYHISRGYKIPCCVGVQQSTGFWPHSHVGTWFCLTQHGKTPPHRDACNSAKRHREETQLSVSSTEPFPAALTVAL